MINLRLALSCRLFQLCLTASFLILRCVRAQNLSPETLSYIVRIIVAAQCLGSQGVAHGTLEGSPKTLPGSLQVKTVFIRIWRHYFSLSPCCHLHYGGKQGWKSQWEITTRPLEWLVLWLPVCVSDAGECPALMVDVNCCSCSGKPFGGFLHSYTLTYPVTHQREHSFTKGLVLVKNCNGSFIHSPKLGTTQILPLRREQINEFWYIYTVDK